MVIAGDRQHMVGINNPDYLKYMMSLNTNGARAWTVKRTTGIQPIASNIELRTVVSRHAGIMLRFLRPVREEAAVSILRLKRRAATPIRRSNSVGAWFFRTVPAAAR